MNMLASSHCWVVATGHYLVTFFHCSWDRMSPRCGIEFHSLSDLRSGKRPISKTVKTGQGPGDTEGRNVKCDPQKKERNGCGYFSRTWFSCSHMVVKPISYCTRKCACKGGCTSASCFLQPHRNGSTGQVPVLEHKTFSRTLLIFLKDCPRSTS